MSHASHLALAYLLLAWAVRLVMLIVVPLRRPPETARNWLLLFLFVPLPALLLYRLVGSARFPRWRERRFAELQPMFAEVADALPRADPAERAALLAERLGGFPPVSGTAVALLPRYDETVDRIVADVDAARRHVHVLAYLFADDATGGRVIEALGRARARGVETRVLIDAAGSHRWAQRVEHALRARQVPAQVMLPVRLARLRRTRADLRNHRKCYLIDGRIGYVGSQNLVARDFRPGVVNDELVARVEGPVVAAMEAVFAGDWYLETGERLDLPPLAPPAGERRAQLLPSGPDYPVPGFERLLVALVHEANVRVVIASPYVIPDAALLSAMQSAHLRGVVIDLIVSKIADQQLVALAQRSYYDELLGAGVRVHEYRERLLHAKHVSVDDRVGVIGSSNADARSFTLNAELSLLLYDADEIALLVAIQDDCIARSDLLDRAAWDRRSPLVKFAQNMARMVSPLL